ncbi:MAG: hypothetical protein J1F23_06365 [Oscillospiraceae bacterium]|nr:hypothetical protein [Oscillospiraceae bacterium]
MKKAISIVLALAMVFVMSLSVFAAEKPEDPDDVQGWIDYFTELFADEEAEVDPAEFLNDFMSMSQETRLAVLRALVEQTDDPELKDMLDRLEGIIGGSGDDEGDDDNGSFLPDFGGLELPEFNFDGIKDTLGTIFDTVFGALGGIVGMLFGGNSGEEDPTTPTEPDDDPWGDEGDGGLGDDGFGDGFDDFNGNSLGDTTVFSVAAIAAVAGVALVLTRKKSKEDDAE